MKGLTAEVVCVSSRVAEICGVAGHPAIKAGRITRGLGVDWNHHIGVVPGFEERTTQHDQPASWIRPKTYR